MKVLLTGARGGVAACIAAAIAKDPSYARSSAIILHDPREGRERALVSADIEASGGVLARADVGEDAPSACARAIRSGSTALDVCVSPHCGQVLDAAMIVSSGADVVVHCDGGGALSQACASAEACARIRGSNATPMFALAVANAITGTVFIDTGIAQSKTLYEALRPSSTAMLAEELTSSNDTARDEIQAALHWEFLRAHPETRPLLGITGSDVSKCLPGNNVRDVEAPGTATMCALVAAVAVSKCRAAMGGAANAKRLREADQWTHVEALALYRPDRADAHLAPASEKSEYEALPSGDAAADDANADDEDEDEYEAFDTQAKLFGYDSLGKLREMYVLVCGADSGANDACIAAFAAIGVGNVDVFGSSGDSERFVQRECAVDDLCGIDNLASYKYNVVVRTSAYAEADEIIAMAREVNAPVIEISSDVAGSCRLRVGARAAAMSPRGAFVGCMDSFTANVAANVAAMEIVRVAQGRPRSAELVYDGTGVFPVPNVEEQ
jgi:hypothetical protein